MSSWPTEITQLISEVDQLTAAVNVKKSSLDQIVVSAQNSSLLAANSAVAAANSAAAALASFQTAEGHKNTAVGVYGSLAAQQTALANAQNASMNASFAADSASSIQQQNLSGINAAALHRSPNAVTAMFIYDTSKDSDGGAWTEKCQHTSWYNEPLMGKWLGAQASEAAARAVSGATTGDYFQHTTDGRFYRLNADSGITEVFRGNKRDFPRLAAIVGENSGSTATLSIYDLTEPGRPMWMRIFAAAWAPMAGLLQGLGMLNGKLLVCLNQALAEIDFPIDAMFQRTNSGQTRHVNDISRRHVVGTPTSRLLTGLSGIANSNVSAVAMTVLPDAPVDPVTGLRVPTIAVATAGGVSLIQHDGVVRNSAATSGFGEVLLSPIALHARTATGGSGWFVAYQPGSLGASFALPPRTFTGDFTPSGTSNVRMRAAGRSTLFKNESNAPRVIIAKVNESSSNRSVSARITNTFNTGWMTGDVRRCFLSDTEVGSLTGPVADRSYKAASASLTGTLTRAQLATGTSLVGYSGFSSDNYLREPYSADLDFGTGEWTASVWVNIPASVSAGIIFDRAAASGASIRLGITATGQLTATASDDTTTRTVTTTAAYNTAQWLKARVNYTTDGTLAILVNGREVAVIRGAPLLTLNNPDAVLTIGNSFALDAPFPGSIALLKLGATVPNQEQETFMFEQEKQLFRDGAISVLPDSDAIVDMSYDDATDRWVAISATNESYWTGLVRNSVTPVPAGSYSRVATTSGVELTARTTINPGVDITIPEYILREELLKRSEPQSRLNRQVATFDYIGGFTGNITTGSTAISSVTNLTYPVSYIGARINGTGIPANTTITGVSGTTIYISAPATATTTSASITFQDFELPMGYTAEMVSSGGTVRREGSTADYTRLFDGFVEMIRFAVDPGATAHVQIKASRSIS